MSSYQEQISYLSGVNETYLAELYARYLNDPGSVDPSWADIFVDMGDDAAVLNDDMEGASWAPRQTSVVGGDGGLQTISDATAGVQPAAPSQQMQYVMGGGAVSEQIRRATLKQLARSS